MPTLLISDTKYTALWRIIPQTGAAINVTHHTEKLTHDAVTYLPASLLPSEQQLIENLDPSNLEVLLPLAQGGVTEAEVLGGKWDGAQVEVRIYDYLNAQVKRAWTGRLATVHVVNGQLKAEVLDTAILLNQPIGDVYSEQCRADHGDAKCGRTPQTWAVTVQGVTSRQEFVVSGNYTEDQLLYGLLEFTGAAANQGFKQEIKSVTNEGGNCRIKTFQSFIYTITVADPITLHEGCRKRFEDCIAKNNAARFRGEPGIPGRYRLFKFPE